MIKIDKDNQTTTDAITVWGPEGQLAILQEEAAELISAIAQYNRNRVDGRKIAEELGDVFVSAMSVLKALGIEEEVEMEMKYKIKRLAVRIEKVLERNNVDDI